MAKKELRLAVVIYGGASLAVYMHGVTKELIKLVRASKVLHELGPERAAGMRYAEGPDRRAPDTESEYFEILKLINREHHFRVVIDVIAGASAGAINGVMLAKGLVDDARLDAQTALWLDGADSETLAAENVGAWKKWYLYPFLRGLSFWLPRDVASSPETRRKITRLVRSSWFRPPFSGERLCHLFFDSFDQLATTRRAGSTLLPPGQRLDVYASLTDLAGYPRTIRLNERLVAREKEHAAFCRLSHTDGFAGASSDFGDDNVPALVWAARASSSYAGAFPPFRHDEIERVLAARGRDWPGQADFLADNVRARDGSPASRHFDPAARFFVDGGIVNNKPFGAVLEALNHRAADRQVHRRLLYIEPDPSVQESFDPGRTLGYLGTLRAALSSIPRNQPIIDELNAVVAQDARVQVNRRVVDAHRSRIAEITGEVRRAHAGQPLTATLVTYLRQAVEDRAEDEMGLAFAGYVQRRIWRLVDALVGAWVELGGTAGESELGPALEYALAESWATGTDPGARSGARREHRQQVFLDQFDVSYRIRRLQFLIRRINQHASEHARDPATVESLDALKQTVYGFTERCFRLRRADQLEENLVSNLRGAAQALPLAREFIRGLLGQLARALGLEALDREFDGAFARFLTALPTEDVRDAVLADYAGFPLFDVLLLAPGALDSGPDPLTPIRIERISPADAPALREAFEGLRSRDFMGFLGFFNRDYRAHDYLWGRLNGAERLIDMLIDAAGGALENPLALKRRLFESIIEVERDRLPGMAAHLDSIAAAIARLDPG